MQSIFNEEFGTLKESSFNPFTDEFKTEKVIGGKVFRNILDEKLSTTFVTQVNEPNDIDYDPKNDEEIDRFYAYIGDALGYLKVWDLNYLIK